MVVQATIAQQWEICLRNPDAPNEVYHYPYYLRSEDNDWAEFLELLAQISADRFVLVTEEALPAHLVSACAERLEQLAPCTVFSFPGGEATKNLVTVGELGNALLSAGVTRSSVIVALGGGPVGNVAGLLASLCLREIRAAACELVKNVLAIRPDMLDEVLALLRPDARYSQTQLARVIALCIEAKTSLMANDALEKHGALALEYGHTVGHSVELLSRGTLSHGEAIGIGMVVEAELSHQLGLLSAADVQLHYTLLHANGAPTAIPPEQHVERLLSLMRRDNKRGYLPPREDTIDLVLLEGLGRPKRTGQTLVTQVAERDVRAALTRCQVA